MLHAYLFLAAFVPLTFLFAASALLLMLIAKDSGRCYWLHARTWARISLFLAGARVSLRGVENLPSGPVIFMSNHQSNFDILSFFAVMPCQLYWIAKKELFDIPVFGNSMRRAGYIPLDRSDGRKALKSMDEAAALIRSGRSVVMFPEGTRSEDFKLLPFKRGGFLLAMRAGVPVVPVTVDGSGRVNPANRTFIRGGNITITLHQPLTPSQLSSRAVAEAELMDRVRSAIESTLET